MHRLARHPELGQIAQGGAIDPVVGLRQVRGLVFGQTHVFEHVAPGAQRGVEGFAHDVVSPRLVEFIDMHPVAGAGHDMKIGAGLAGIGHDLGGFVTVIDCDHQHLRLGQTGGFEQFGAGGITEEALDAETAQRREGGHVAVEHHGGKARQPRHAVDHLAKAPDARDDDAAFLVDLVGVMVRRAGGQAARQLFVGDEQRGRQQHRQADHQQGDLGGGGGKDGLLHRKTDDQKAELAALGQAKGEQPALAPAQFEEPGQREQHQCLDGNQPQRQAEDGERHARQQAKVDADADGHEEQAHQDALEGLDVGFKLMAELRVGQHHPGQKGAERWRQADQHHQKGDAEHHQERDEGRNLGQLGGMDEAKHRARQEMPGQDDAAHDRQGQQGDTPARQRLHQRHQRLGGRDRFGVGRIGDAEGLGGDGKVAARGQQWDQRQHRHHRDVLGQQHGKAGAPATGAHQVLLGQGLQHDGGGRQRGQQPQDQRHLPAQPEPDQGGGDQRCGQGDLQAAKAKQAVAHLPQGAGLQLQPDQEQHHHHAEFGEVLQVGGFAPGEAEQGPQHQAGGQVAQHRAQPQPHRQRHNQHSGPKVEAGLQQKSFHRAPFRDCASAVAAGSGGFAPPHPRRIFGPMRKRQRQKTKVAAVPSWFRCAASPA